VAVSKKVTIIGGGSSSFVPLLLRRLISSPVLGDSHVALMDIDEHRLEVMQRLGEKLIEGESASTS
jgi:alpha-galactosidase